LNLKANNLFIDSELLYEKGKSIKTNGRSFFDSSNLNIKEPISYPNRDVKLLKMSKKFRICQQAIKKISLLNSNSTVLILANDNTIYYSSIEKILSSSATSPFTPYPQFSSEGHENVDFIENLILDAKHDSLWFFDAEKQFEHVQTVDLSKEAMNGYSYSSSTDKNIFCINGMYEISLFDLRDSKRKQTMEIKQKCGFITCQSLNYDQNLVYFTTSKNRLSYFDLRYSVSIGFIELPSSLNCRKMFTFPKDVPNACFLSLYKNNNVLKYDLLKSSIEEIQALPDQYQSSAFINSIKINPQNKSILFATSNGMLSTNSAENKQSCGVLFYSEYPLMYVAYCDQNFLIVDYRGNLSVLN